MSSFSFKIKLYVNNVRKLIYSRIKNTYHRSLRTKYNLLIKKNKKYILLFRTEHTLSNLIVLKITIATLKTTSFLKATAQKV